MSQVIAGNANAYGMPGVPQAPYPSVTPLTPQVQQPQPLLQEPNNNISSKLGHGQWNSEPIVDSSGTNNGSTSNAVCNCASFLDPFPNQITWR